MSPKTKQIYKFLGTLYIIKEKSILNFTKTCSSGFEKKFKFKTARETPNK